MSQGQGAFAYALATNTGKSSRPGAARRGSVRRAMTRAAISAASNSSLAPHGILQVGFASQWRFQGALPHSTGLVFSST
jgi:hypothetical protein